MSVASGYVHISLRNAQNRAGSGSQRQTAVGGFPGSYGAQPFGNQSYGIPASSGTGARPLRAVQSQDASPMTAPMPVVTPNGIPGPQPVSNDTAARGFVIYVGLDEETAAANGTSLSKLAQEIRAYVQTLVPGAQSHAAVALAPAGAVGSDIDVVRQALGDPTVRRQPAPQQVPAPPVPAAIRPSGVLIDLSRREVHLDGDTLNLTFKEFELLNYLVENASRTVGREELLAGLWRNAEEVPNERTIDVHIRRLRSKLGRLANTVRTVRGQGYRFYEHPEVVVWAAPEYSI
ncbi:MULTISPECIES: winged helix-turn-helix domain-containing protein [unclassified Arthrobacter]|uniref:winged helix-turn-helix domain-containing protein n=1 Tax=unclassified Arthrobacter TaxID=235627 RepID=UPI0021070129|nr:MULTISPECIES: winged helix-turn-helix domain-containing protein [unclassified Arthrobacter]MCQ1948218.1 winged helix-turn-helix domain-containing protein [Arthrobacter sp. zg-Y1116]MCQ1996596.1 winged helix-turn-helix domain-containing protein [Arthrobacter sp. zg-Y1171]UWX82195.1 winged helix-turn-helix domain-containing protein [Arthrobacter sp. zg-Y1171]